MDSEFKVLGSEFRVPSNKYTKQPFPISLNFELGTPNKNMVMVLNKKILPSIAIALLICLHCGKAPGPLPAMLTGSVRITAAGSSPIDSIRVVLDDRDMGKYPNPATLGQIAAGFHKLSLFIGGAATSPQAVEIRRGEITSIAVVFNAGPYPGNPAPLFAVKDVRGDSLSLPKQKGKAVLLIFFEHT
jgi:hypothetical protein